MGNYAEWIRTEFKKGDDLRDAGLKTPEDIVRFDDLPYGTDPLWHLLDVYRPKNAEGRKLPVIVNVHGGGFVYGTKETYQFYCMSLARKGFAVVSFNYRLAPENKFPSALEDCCKAFAWTLAHGEEYGFDLDYVFAAGDSAGTTILSQFCNLCTNPDYAAKLPSCQAPAGFVPKAVALNCGDYKYVRPDGPEDPEAVVQSLLPYIFENGGTDEELALANVAGNVTANFPPCYLMTCEDDFLKWGLLVIEQELLAHSVPFEAQFYVSAKEKLGHVFHCGIKSGLARFCNEQQIRFFRQFIQ
ncbi:MAG: alpha/beta hydrolase [Erysipelotrichaceae bacterium]|nr:alpha/beta hydrolase [Erysipelotrichaceae bacterium]